MAGYFPHGFGGCSLCGRSGEMGGLLDQMGMPEIKNRLGDTLDQVEKTIKDTAKRTMKRVQFRLPQGGLSHVMDTARNTLKSDIAAGVSSGVGQGTEQAKSQFAPWMIGAGVLGVALIYVLWRKKR